MDYEGHKEGGWGDERERKDFYDTLALRPVVEWRRGDGLVLMGLLCFTDIFRMTVYGF